VRTNQPVIVDLGISDIEYLELLANGEDPIQKFHNQAYEAALLCYGIPTSQACLVAPLLDKSNCSIEEKIWVNQTLRQIWEWLTVSR
jgi:hypothetical protein